MDRVHVELGVLGGLVRVRARARVRVELARARRPVAQRLELLAEAVEPGWG